MKVIIVEEKAEVYTPYNPKFVNIIKRAIGGAKWESTKNVGWYQLKVFQLYEQRSTTLNCKQSKWPSQTKQIEYYSITKCPGLTIIAGPGLDYFLLNVICFAFNGVFKSIYQLGYKGWQRHTYFG